ncbi:MAG: chromate transporter [Candidatus Binataceae bacterium]
MDEARPAAISLAKIFWVFLYIGATSFGGGLIAYLREHLVDRQRWLDDEQFLAALEIGQTVPGLISTNVSVIVGSRFRGARGAIVAAMGMVLPGAIAVFALGVAYAHFKSNPAVVAALGGVAAAAVGLILAVTIQIGKRELKFGTDLALLGCAFLLVAIWHISLVPVLVVIAPIAIWLNRPAQEELSAYHAQQAEYHAQLAAHHGEKARVHGAADTEFPA